MKRQFTATTYIIDQDKVLLIYHKKQRKWLPPGGHVEENEMPHECAIREALEETGFEVELLLQENNWFDEPNAVSIPRPWGCQLEKIAAYKNEEAHEHIDFVYVGRPVSGTLNGEDEGVGDIRWFKLEEVESLPSVDIYDDTKKSLRAIFASQLFSGTCNTI